MSRILIVALTYHGYKPINSINLIRDEREENVGSEKLLCWKGG
jgi:hypothetical protein